MTQSERFWCLRSAESTHDYAEWDEDVELEQITCPLREGHQRPGRRTGSLRVVLPSARVDDLVSTWYSEWLVQSQVLERLRERGFTGFQALAVGVGGIRSKRGETLPISEQEPQLWELSVTGWGGEAPAESGIQMTYYCEGCGHTRYSDCAHPEHLVDVDQWDRSDFFTVWPLPKFVLVTDRVADLIREEGYSGCQLVRPADLNLSGGFAPGRPPPGRSVRGPEAFPDAEVIRLPEQ
jgi:hypothetical protein